MSFLLETSDFCVAISKSKPEFSEWSGTILYSFHIELLGGVKFDLSASDLILPIFLTKGKKKKIEQQIGHLEERLE